MFTLFKFVKLYFIFSTAKSLLLLEAFLEVLANSWSVCMPQHLPLYGVRGALPMLIINNPPHVSNLSNGIDYLAQQGKSRL